MYLIFFIYIFKGFKLHNFMIINDRVYRGQEISEPVLLDLIQTPEIQRLRRISQFGMPSYLYNYPTFQRFEHSLGVMLLLRELNASLEEQVAGLVHDVSHSAFSHLIDWIYGTETQENHQDEVLHERIRESSLPKILKRYGFDHQRVSNHDNYLLLEQEAPLLCADRVDSALREMALCRNPEDVPFLRRSLIVHNRIMFDNKEAAEIFAENYMDCQLNHWGAVEYKTRWRLLSQALKYAMEEGTISYDDLFTHDAAVLEKIGRSSNQAIRQNLNLLMGKLNIVEDLEGPIVLKKKFRYVDPEFLEQERVYRVTEVNPKYKEQLDYEKEKGKEITRFRIVT